MEEELQLSHLPLEMLMEIFTHLDPETIPAVGAVSKQFNSVANNELLWKKKLKQHFPNYDHRKKKKEQSWISQFHDTYTTEYKDLPLKKRKLFSMVKENNVTGLKNEILDMTDFLDLTSKEDQPLLHLAIEKGNQAILDLFYQTVINYYDLGLTVDTQKTDHHGRTILHWAVDCRQSLETLDLLILQGANINVSSQSATPLQLAADKAYPEILKFLIEKGSNINEGNNSTALMLATQQNSIECIKLLLAKGANPNLSRQIDDATPLHIAAQEKYVEAAELLLANGADPNIQCEREITPLHLAINENCYPIVKMLLEKNADVTINCINDINAMHLAAELGNYEIFRLLLSYGGNSNANCSNARTPLHIATYFGHLDLVKALIANRANIDASCARQNTALYLAAQEGHIEIARYLLKKGANKDQICENGMTPLNIAIKNNHYDIANLLASPTLDSKNRMNGNFTLFGKQDIANEIEDAEAFRASKRARQI